jgi:hypothetical protein
VQPSWNASPVSVLPQLSSPGTHKAHNCKSIGCRIRTCDLPFTRQSCALHFGQDFHNRESDGAIRGRIYFQYCTSRLQNRALVWRPSCCTPTDFRSDLICLLCSERQFVVSYFMADDSISVFEHPTDGFPGGKFLERGQVAKNKHQTVYNHKLIIVRHSPPPPPPSPFPPGTV